MSLKFAALQDFFKPSIGRFSFLRSSLQRFGRLIIPIISIKSSFSSFLAHTKNNGIYRLTTLCLTSVFTNQCVQIITNFGLKWHSARQMVNNFCRHKFYTTLRTNHFRLSRKITVRQHGNTNRKHKAPYKWCSYLQQQLWRDIKKKEFS